MDASPRRSQAWPYDDVTYVYDDVTYVYDDVTYVYDDVTHRARGVRRRDLCQRTGRRKMIF